jgi:hypothetical protein
VFTVRIFCVVGLIYCGVILPHIILVTTFKICVEGEINKIGNINKTA